MVALISFLTGLALFLTGVWIFLPDKTKAQFINILANWTIASVKAIVSALTTLEDDLATIAVEFVSAWQDKGPNLLNTLKGPITDTVQDTVNLTILDLVNAGASTPDNAVDTAVKAFSDAFGFGLASHGVTAMFEAVLPEKLNTVNGIGPALANMAGFEDVSKALRDPLYENAFGKSLRYHFRNIFKPDLPSDAQAVRWHARRYITDAQLKDLFQYSGLKSEWEDTYVNAAYTTIQPRALSTLFEDAPVDVSQMTLLLQRAGLAPEQIPILLSAIQWKSVANVRSEYISALVRSTELGTETMAGMVNELQTIGYSQQAIDLIQLTVATRKELQLAELYRKSISEAYKYGTITDAQYVPSLEAIGIGAADAQAHYAVDSIAKQGKAAAAALKAEERLQAQQMRAAGKAAIAGYRAGTYDAAALEAALLAAGYDPAVAGYAVAYETFKQEGNQIYIYGVTLPRAQAVLLREQVGALGVQVKAQLVTPAAALAALAGYGVPSANAQALVAEWAATHTPASDVGVLEPR